MVFAGLAGVALLAAAAPAGAQSPEATPPPLTLGSPEALPFSDSELQQALLARLLPPGDDAGTAGLPRVSVEPAAEGAVTVRVGARSRLVTIGDRSGPGAARVVALVIAELLTAAAEPPAEAAEPAVDPVPAARPAPSAPPSSSAVEAELSARPPGPLAAAWVQRLSVTAGVAKGTNGDELIAGTLDADVAVPLPWGGLRLYPSAGLTIMPTRNGGTADQVSFFAVSARALCGAGFGPVDVAAGVVVSPYTIDGAVAHVGVLLGGEAMAQLTAPLSDRLRLVVGGRLDVFADRVRILFADGGMYATPRVGIGLAAGLAWDWTS